MLSICVILYATLLMYGAFVTEPINELVLAIVSKITAVSPHMCPEPFLVRKTGHFLAYAALAAISYICTTGNHKLRALRALSITTTIACTDELIQAFVPHRSGRLTDVGIDLLGAMTFLLLTHLISPVRGKRKRPAKDQNTH